MKWLHNGEKVTEVREDSIGFVYEITCPTGHRYIGKKLCISNRKKVIKGRNRRVLVETDWKTYCGSSEELKHLVKVYGLDKFKREILFWCKDKSAMAYLEMKTIFEKDALLKNEYLNKWVTCQINGKNLKSLKTPFTMGDIPAIEEKIVADFKLEPLREVDKNLYDSALKGIVND